MPGATVGTRRYPRGVMFQLRFSMRTPPEGRTPRQEATARTAAYRAAIEMVEWGEDNGNAATVISEHHASPDGYLPSPLVLASAMAARTRTTPIVIAALLGLLYDPLRLAEDLAVLDHVSGGRVLCVLGMGYRSEEYRMFGVDEGSRGAQMEALLATLRRAWTSEAFEHPPRGTVRVTPAPAGDGGPPLAYGGHSPAAARRAARHGLMFMAEAGSDDLRRAYDDEARRTGVAAPGCMLASPGDATTVFVSDDLDGAWAELGPRMLHEIRLYRKWNAAAGKSGIASISEADDVEALRAEGGSYRIYTSAEATDRVATGEMLMLEPLCGGLPPERAWHYLHNAAAASHRP